MDGLSRRGGDDGTGVEIEKKKGKRRPEAVRIILLAFMGENTASFT